MRRIPKAIALCVLLLTLPGCIIVLGAKDWPQCRHVVQIDGEWYLVDAEGHRLKKVEIEGTVEGEKTVEEAPAGD